MKSANTLVMVASLAMALSFVIPPFSAQTVPEDPGWPRVLKQDGKQLTIYQPQVDYWIGYTNLHLRCAIAVKTSSSAKEKFGVAEINALTVADHETRVVALIPLTRDLRFPNSTDSEIASLRATVNQLHPPGQALTLSLDRVLAYLDPATQPRQRAVEVNVAPPKIFYSRKPAVLIMFMGEPDFKPVETNRTDLLFAVNTNWDVFYDSASQHYFLLNGESWLMTPDLAQGPWSPAKQLPASLAALPAHENWAEVRQRIPGKASKETPVVLVSTEPAELIITKGEPNFSPISGTRLMRVTDTDSVLFLNSADAKYYFLVAGRWFQTASLDGPWSAASQGLPAEFTKIPDNNPAAFVKASVPGTREAQDAVLLASVPTTTVVNLTNVTVQVSYAGQPQFVSIPDTTVQYAANSPYTVFLVNGGYYCCDKGVWFCGATANGPWTFCTSVPQAIYGIPPSHPTHNVTYVVVESSTPTTVVYSQTAGYSGEYVAATGVLMFGAGLLIGAAIADDHDHYHYPHYPAHYSYGCGATYSHAYGGYYRAAHVSYGPYGGAGRAAAYNPATGTYARGAYAYGPYGGASARQAYNPYTGGWAQAAHVSTAYGSAGRGSAYNPYTGTTARGGYRSGPNGSVAAGEAYNYRTGGYAQGARVETAGGSAGRFYAEQGGESAWGGYRSSDYGTVGGIKTSEGSGAAAWDTQHGQGAVAKDKDGNVYAGKDGTAYKRDSNGNWTSNSGDGWNSVDKPQPTRSGAQPTASTSSRSQWGGTSATTTASRDSRQGLESQAQARQYGNRQSQQASQSRSSGRSSSSSWSGGSRRR